MSYQESKYLEFRYVERTKKTKIWEIVSKSSGCRLGLIKWYGAWRQYTFYPEQYTFYNSKCLKDITSFLNCENELHKLMRKHNFT